MKTDIQLTTFQLGSMANDARQVISQKKKKGEEVTQFDIDYFKNMNNALTCIRNCRKIKAHVESLKANQPPQPPQPTDISTPVEELGSSEEE